MMYDLVFHPKAEAEFLEAINWYDKQQVKLSNQFIDKVDLILLELRINPQRYKIVKKQFHEALVDVFPYVITYKMLEAEKIVFISAIFHTSRNPKQKFRK